MRDTGFMISEPASKEPHDPQEKWVRRILSICPISRNLNLLECGSTGIDCLWFISTTFWPFFRYECVAASFMYFSASSSGRTLQGQSIA